VGDFTPFFCLSFLFHFYVIFSPRLHLVRSGKKRRKARKEEGRGKKEKGVGRKGRTDLSAEVPFPSSSTSLSGQRRKEKKGSTWWFLSLLFLLFRTFPYSFRWRYGREASAGRAQKEGGKGKKKREG